MSRWRTSLAAGCLLVLGWALQAQEGYKVIVNPANPISSVTRVQAFRFFLERAAWDDGQPVAAVDLPPTSAVREVFSKEVLGMPTSSVIARWRDPASRRGNPPPSVATDREVLAYVRLKPGAIGYVSAATDTQGVKVISIGRSDSGPTLEIVEVGGTIPMPERIVSVPPVYPVPARTARLQGDVDVEIVIGPTGNVEAVRVVRTVRGLDEAAISAVKQWKYRPTLVNGQPVRVKAIVRVSFVL